MSTLTPSLNVMVGAPGSGKSTIVEIMKSAWQHKRFTIICPDELREKHCNGDRGDQSKNGIVWKEAYELLEEAMKDKKDVIFDSTMMSRKRRKDLVRLAKQYKYYLHAHVVEKPKEVIVEQNKNRKWRVPDFVIDRMLDSYEAPTNEEGFHRVTFYREDIK